MGVAYRAVGWNRQKRIYDGVLGAGLALFLAVFVAVGAWLHPDVTAETLLIRGLGAAAFVLLHVVLTIGPLCRLDRRFLPLLYNRRHLGVTLFMTGLAHAGFVLFQFHALGDTNPLVSVLTANTRYRSLTQFPFEILGLGALAILFLMAATSHDFWLANLTPAAWKALHMGVYLAYGLLVLHVALGTLQAETHPALVALLGAGVAWVAGLHLLAARRERPRDAEAAPQRDGWVDAGPAATIEENRARVVSVGGERVAIFRHDGKISAVSNVCRHQNGPLGEGRIVDGCITCPWHGYQYVPETGASPPPFHEKVPTFRVRVERGRVLVHPRPNPAGTRVEPATIGALAQASDS